MKLRYNEAQCVPERIVECSWSNISPFHLPRLLFVGGSL